MDADDKALLRRMAEQFEAVAAENRMLRLAQEARRSTGKTLEQLFQMYEATWAAESWAPSMRGTLRPALRHFGTRVADEITRADWIHWRDHVRAAETTIRKGPPTVYTRNQEFKRWRTVYRWGISEGHCHTNPLVDVRAARGAKKHRETEPTQADLVAIRPHCDAITWAFLLLAFRRGFRASEARRLEWKQVDLERGRIALWAWQEKTRRAHVLRVTSDVVEALKAIRPDVPGRCVFPGPDGSPMHSTTMWRRVRIAIDAAGLEAAPGDKRMTYHDWRHGFASSAARKVGLQVAMRLSRHKSLSAAQKYIHVNESDLDEAHEKLEEAVRMGPKRAEVNPEHVNSGVQVPAPKHESR